jgi:HAT1-interacting factor 1
MQLVDLRRSPVSLNDNNQNADGLNTLNGILGQIMGKTPEEQKTHLNEVAKSANDLSALVRKKKAPSDPANRKRSNESSRQGETVKRNRVEDTS